MKNESKILLGFFGLVLVVVGIYGYISLGVPQGTCKEETDCYNGQICANINATTGEGICTTIVIEQSQQGGIVNTAYPIGTAQPITNPVQTQVVNTPVNPANSVPVQTLKTAVKNKYTQASVTATYNVSFYVPNADVSDPYILPLDNIEVSAATSQTTNSIIQTLGSYDTYAVGYGTYYDEKLAGANVNYNEQTGVGYLLVNGDSYVKALPVGAFVNQDTVPEKTSTIKDVGTDTLNYSTSDTGSAGYFRMDLGNNNANSELINVVLCIKDTGNDGLDGTEVTGLTATYVSGSTKIRVPGDLQRYWDDAAGSGNAVCLPIAQNLGPSEKARWEFTLTVATAEWTAGEQFAIIQDDVSNYLAKQYPSRNTKATAEILYLNNT